VLGKFLALALLLAVSLVILYLLAAIAIFLTALKYPPAQPLNWQSYVLVMVFEYVMLLVISGVSILLNSFATSTFLPMALTIAVYCIGQSTAVVKDYLDKAPQAERPSQMVAILAKAGYYLFPNLSAFDLKAVFVYSLPVDVQYRLMVLLYGLFYLTVVMGMATYFFERRDLS
ncbi:MAG: hypothetical protein P8017_17955, partial [Deltaproteobacteria bacterium]